MRQVRQRAHTLPARTAPPREVQRIMKAGGGRETEAGVRNSKRRGANASPPAACHWTPGLQAQQAQRGRVRQFLLEGLHQRPLLRGAGLHVTVQVR